MKANKNKSLELRLRRKKRIRTRVTGTPERPRLCIYKSNRHLYVQVIDDVAGKTLISVSTLAPELKADVKGGQVEQGKLIGTKAAELCKTQGIVKVVFDRNGFIYKKGGRIDAIATGARKGGLDF
jgi:large subunit ribosomal protein L18